MSLHSCGRFVKMRYHWMLRHDKMIPLDAPCIYQWSNVSTMSVRVWLSQARQEGWSRGRPRRSSDLDPGEADATHAGEGLGVLFGGR